MDPRGTGLVVASAASFGVMAVLAKDGASTGAGVTTILTGRFLVAALLFALLAAARGTRLRTLPRRAVLQTLALGAVLYATESSVYFSALDHVDASIASLVICTYPALVLVLAVALRRERAHARQIVALVLALGGALLVLSAGAGGHIDGIGLALTLGSTVLYATYVTVADSVSGDLDPLAFGGLLSAGAATSLVALGTLTGRLHPAAYADPSLLADVALIAVVSTVLAVTAFFAGMRRIGATGASTVASIEPVFTVLLAAAFLHERLTGVQAVGGLVVLSGILLVKGGQVPGSLPGDGSPARPAPPAAARALTLEPA